MLGRWGWVGGHSPGAWEGTEGGKGLPQVSLEHRQGRGKEGAPSSLHARECGLLCGLCQKLTGPLAPTLC